MSSITQDITFSPRPFPSVLNITKVMKKLALVAFYLTGSIVAEAAPAPVAPSTASSLPATKASGPVKATTPAVQAAGATQTWNPGGAGGGTGNWSGTNWDSASAWVSGNIALFGGTAGTVTVGTQTVGGITFNQTGYTLSGGTLNIPNTGFTLTTTSGTNTVSSPLVGASSPQMTKTGPGILVLGNLTATAGTPLLTITGGTFNSTTGAFDSVAQLVAGNALGNAPAAATTEFALSAGTLRFTQSSGGNLLASTRAVQVGASGGAINDASASTAAQINGPITFNAGTTGTNLYLSNSAGGITTFTGTSIISGTGNVVWNGAGTAIFQASNTYTGGTTVNKGTLQLSGGSLGNNNISVASGANLLAQGGIFKFDLSNSADRLVVQGNITLSGTSSIRLNTGSLASLSPGSSYLLISAAGNSSLGAFQLDGGSALSVPAQSLIKNVGGTYYRLTLQNSASAEQVVVTAAPARVINEMPLGSSITEGVSGEGATYAGGGYRSQLYQMLVNDGRFTPHFVGSNTVLDNNAAAGYNVLSGANELHHEGHSGYTTSQVLTNLNSAGNWLAPNNGVNPDYVTLSIGGNDYGNSSTETTGPLLRADAITSTIVALRPAAHVIFANLFYRTQTSGGVKVGDLQNTYYNPGVPVAVYNHVLAGQHVSYVDTYAVTPNNNMSMVSPDGIHPLTSGYQVLATAWYNALAFGSAFWTGAAQDGLWSTVTANSTTNFAHNYSLSTPRQPALGAATDVYFNSNTAPLPTTLGQDLSVRGVNFAAGATGPVTIAGNNTLTLNAGGVTVQNGTGAHTILANVALGTDQTWGNVSANPFTVSGVISGAHALTTTGSYTVQLQVGTSSSVTPSSYTGTGPIVLSGANTYTGGTTVSGGGRLIVNNTAGSGTGTGAVTVSNTTTLVDNGSVSGSVSVSGTAGGTGVYGGAVTVNSDGLFNGAATINGLLTVNGGGSVMFSGGTLSANGGVVNNGTIRLERGAVLAVASGSTFTNNGILDVLTGGLTAPDGFTNNGVVIDSSAVRTRSVDMSGGAVTLTVDSFTGHTYQLQRNDSLADGSFANLGAAQAGTTGAVLTFQDANPSPTQGFYRVQIDP